MYTIQQYIEDTLSLTNSIIIKFKDNALFVNKRIRDFYGIEIPEDPKEWRYYLNLNGEKHFTNTDVKIYILEEDTKVLLTKEILNQYPLTKEELLKYGSLYKSLIKEYPNDIDYIKGCIFPIDYETAINAEDGDILAYNINLIEEQELSIIKELEKQIKNHIARWHVREYSITDELYISSYIGVLYSAIPRMIMNIRLSKIKTNEAHSFHVEQYFRSNLNLWDDIRILNKESIYWLYKNLDYLMSNVGRNKTLDIIAKKIFETNKIGLGVYEILSIDPDIKNDSIVLNEPLFKPTKLNNYYNNDIEFASTNENIVTKELNSDAELSREINNLEKDRVISTVKEKTKYLLSDKTSKIIDVNTIRTFELYGNDLITNLLDYWLDFSFTGVYTKKINFVDPNNNINYFITPKQGLLYLLYMISIITNNEDKRIHKMEYRTTINTDITYDEITKDMFDAGISKNSLTKLYNLIPNKINKIKSPDEFNNYFSKLVTLYIEGRVEEVNIDNPIVSNNIKTFYRKILKKKTVHLEGKTFKEMLEDDNINIEINSLYDPMLTILTLTKVFTNTDIDNTLELINMLKSYINILLKLTSYDTQIISDDIENNILKAPYTSNSIINTTQGLLNINNAHLDALEQNFTRIKAHGNDFKEVFKTDLYPDVNYSILSIDHIGVGSIFNYKDFDIKITPTTYADIDALYGVMTATVKGRAMNIFETLLGYSSNYIKQRSRIDTIDIGIENNRNYKDIDTNTNSTYINIEQEHMTQYYPNVNGRGHNQDLHHLDKSYTDSNINNSSIIDKLDIGITNNKNYNELDVNNISMYAEIIDTILTNYYPNVSGNGHNQDMKNVNKSYVDSNIKNKSNLDITDIGIEDNKNYKDIEVGNNNTYANILDDDNMTDYYPDVSGTGHNQDMKNIDKVNNDSNMNVESRLDFNKEIGIVINKYKNIDVNNNSAYAEIIDKYLTEYHPELKSRGVNGENIVKAVNDLNSSPMANVDELSVITYTNEPTTTKVVNIDTQPNTVATID